MQRPPKESWQYCPPERTVQYALGTAGGSGGGEGEGGGGGGPVRAVRLAQRSKPPEVTDPSERHVIDVPAAMKTLKGALSVPWNCSVPNVR